MEAPLASWSALERTHSVQTPVDKDASLASLGEEDYGTMDHRDAEGERGCGTIDAPRTSTVDHRDTEGEREHGACRSIEISLTSAVDQEDDEGNDHYGTVDAPSSTHGNMVDSDSLQCLESLQEYDRLASYPSSPPEVVAYYVGGRSISLIPRLPIQHWNETTSWGAGFLLVEIKTSGSGWSNQRQEDSICYKKFLPGKIITYYTWK